MKIKHLSWKNYRRLPDGHVDVRDHVVLVGPNDTGKSSIVRALHLCLGMAHGQVSAAISFRDFTAADAPLVITVTLDDISDDDRATFPDEITTGPPEELVIAVEATLDPTDPDQTVVKRSFPDGGHTKAPTKDQLSAIAFQFVPAVRSLLRELGGASGGAVRSLISGLDLAADAAALTAAADGYRSALDGSKTLRDFRSELAQALTDAMPNPVADEDVRVATEAEVLDDPLCGVTVTVKDGGHDVPLAEQSDGIRALSVLTLLGMSHKSARIVAIDEPETHLHPSAQRSIAGSLRAGTGQRVLVTHSPCIVGEMNPMDLVVFRSDRQVRQLPPGSPIAEDEATVRHWSYRLIEPLTARIIVAVEGVSDRILVERVAALTDMNLDRMGVAIFDLGGSGLFSLAFNLFGPPGFDLPFVGLTDADARVDWAGVVGVPPADLETNGYIVCDPDLEGVYIDTFGVGHVLTMLLTSPSISERSLLDTCRVANVGGIDRDALWAYCRKGKNKVACALAVAKNMSEAQALALAPLNAVLYLAK